MDIFFTCWSHCFWNSPYVKHLIDTDEAWHNGFSFFYHLLICARKNWIEIKTDSFQQTLSFWKHKNMALSISWSVWRRILSEENWWNLCDCLRPIGTLVWARFGGTNIQVDQEFDSALKFATSFLHLNFVFK